MIAAAGRFFMSLGGGGRLPVGEEAWGDTAIMLRKGVTAGNLCRLIDQRRVEREKP